MAQSIPSMPIPPPPPRPKAFVEYLSSCFGKAANAPQWGLKMGYKCPTPGQHQNILLYLQFIFHFQAAKTIFMGNLNLIKTHEAPYANRP